MGYVSQWGKDVKKALIDRDMTIKELAKLTGHSVSVISALLNGRYAKPNYKLIADEVNAVAGTNGRPERPTVPSESWCKAVRKSMVDNEMNINELSANVGVSRERVSLVVNGNNFDTPVIEGINSLLGITDPVI